MPQFARLSFSMTYKEDKDNELRTLDLTCKNEQEFHLWFWGMQVRSSSVRIACQPGNKMIQQQPRGHTDHVQDKVNINILDETAELAVLIAISLHNISCCVIQLLAHRLSHLVNCTAVCSMLHTHTFAFNVLVFMSGGHGACVSHAYTHILSSPNHNGLSCRALPVPLWPWSLLCGSQFQRRLLPTQPAIRVARSWRGYSYGQSIR